MTSHEFVAQVHFVMTDRLVTVFGGTGFLGRRIVAHLRNSDFSVRIASRHRHRAHNLSASESGSFEAIVSNIRDERSVVRACAGAYGVVNAVSLYVEQGEETFQSVHVQAAERVAAEARRAGAQRLVHISGIGADPASRSAYIRSRGEGEGAVRSGFPGAVIVRPAVMFGPEDKFLTTILDLLRRLPVYPMFGRGDTKLQPVFVEDVAEAVAQCMQAPPYASLLEVIAAEAGLRPILLPMPFFAWHGMAFFAELLPKPTITRNQVELMEFDTIASTHAPSLHDLGIAPQSILPVLRSMLGKAV